METVRVSSKYQIVIPKKIRDFLRLRKKDAVFFEINKDKVEIKKLEKVLARHIGSVRLKKDFIKFRKEFDEEMAG